MHPDQEVRVASHLPARARIGEAIAPDLLFGQPDGDTRLRPLLPARWPAALAAGTAMLGLAVGFAAWWRHERAIERDLLASARQNAATAAARLQAGAARTRQLADLLAQAGHPGAAPLDRWRAAIAALPVSRSVPPRHLLVHPLLEGSLGNGYAQRACLESPHRPSRPSPSP